jgi:hypothetical protein
VGIQFGLRLPKQAVLAMLVFSKIAPEANDVRVPPGDWDHNPERVEFQLSAKHTK